MIRPRPSASITLIASGIFAGIGLSGGKVGRPASGAGPGANWQCAIIAGWVENPRIRENMTSIKFVDWDNRPAVQVGDKAFVARNQGEASVQVDRRGHP